MLYIMNPITGRFSGDLFSGDIAERLMARTRFVAFEPGDLAFYRNLPQGVDGVFELCQVPSKRSWDAARELCPLCPEDIAQSPPSPVPQRGGNWDNLVICVDDLDGEAPEASMREAAPSLETSALQIVEIDPEEDPESAPQPALEAAPRAQLAVAPAVVQTVAPGAAPAAAPQAELAVAPVLAAEAAPEAAPEVLAVVPADELKEPQGVSAFGPQARAAFRAPRSAPELLAPPGQGEEGGLLGPSARLQFKKPRFLATPARALSAGPEEAPKPPGTKAFQSTAGKTHQDPLHSLET